MQAIAHRPVDVLRAQGEGIGPGTRAGPGNLQPAQIARLACQLVQDTRIILTRAGHEGRLVSTP